MTFASRFSPGHIISNLENLICSKFQDKIEVFHFGTGNLYGGVEKILVCLERNKNLAPKLEQKFILLFEGRLSNELISTKSEVYFLGNVRRRYPWQIWYAKRKLSKYLNGKRPGIVLFHSLWSYSLFGLFTKKLGFKIGIWLHDAITELGVSELASKKTHPDFLIANSLYTAGTGKKLFPRTNCEVIYPPIEPFNAFGDAKLFRTRLRRELGSSDKCFVILIAARFDPYKGHKCLFDSLRRLVGFGEWECWIASEPQNQTEFGLLERLKVFATKHGFGNQLKFLGHRTDLHKLFCAADVYCQPNVGPEPFGMLFVEAQVAGCPVITTAMGGAIESVEKNRDNHLLEKPCPELLAAALKNKMSQCRSIT